MKKSSKSSPKQRSLDISLQHKNEASYKFSKKKLLHSTEKRAGAERVNKMIYCIRCLSANLFVDVYTVSVILSCFIECQPQNGPVVKMAQICCAFTKWLSIYIPWPFPPVWG